MKQLLPLLLCVFLVGACSKQVSPTGDKTTTSNPSKKSKTKHTVTGESSSSSSDDVAALPLQLSETDAPMVEADASVSQLTSLKMLQLPAVPNSAWKEGVNYKRLSPVQPTSALPGQIEVTEAFWYGSAHCYVLDQSMAIWRKQKEHYVNFVQLPVMWGSVQRLHARMYYIAALLGKSNELHEAIFQELQVKKAPLNSLEQVQAFFVAHGISQEDFQKANASPAIDASLRQAQIMGDRYRITTVPLVIINGRYITDVAMAGGQAQLLVLINELIAREKGN